MLDAQGLTSRLSGERFGLVTVVPETGSTNADLLAAAAAGAPDGSVLIAGHQTAGRGRLDRRWIDATGGALLLSALIRPTFPGVHAHFATQAMGLAALRACEATSGFAPDLKWPNDLIEPGGRKLGGILAESLASGSEIQALVVGIGLNVSHSDELPQDVAALAVSLDQLAGRPVDAGELAVVLLGELARLCALIDTADGRAELHSLIRERTTTVGQEVSVETGGRRLSGVAVDLLEDGRLVIDAGAGLVPISAGDVSHVRPTSG